MSTGDSQALSTGIPELDLLVGGGLLPRNTLVIGGLPGGGKTVLASQIAFHRARSGDRVVLATVSSEPHARLLDAVRGFRWFDPARVGREVMLLSANPWVRKGVKDVRDVLIDSVREQKARLLVVDGLGSLRSLWRDDVRVRDLLAELGVGLGAQDCAGLYTLESAVPRLLELPESEVVDGIVSVGVREDGMARQRRIEVHKLRGKKHLLGEHSLFIDSDGVHVVPRLETLARASEDFAPASMARSAFGLADLDAQLGGGLPPTAMTLLAGEAGTGKALVGAAFLAHGARTGEKGLYLSLHEPRRSLFAHASAVGIDLEPLCEKGLCEVLYQPAIELDADQVAQRLLREAERLSARRLVIDGTRALERGVRPRDRVHDYFTALSVVLRERGVNALFCYEGDPRSTELSGIAARVLHLRVEGGRHLMQVDSMRAVELTFSPGGVASVLDPASAATALRARGGRA